MSFEIANEVNKLQLVFGNTVSDIKNMVLLTPNRLNLGINNQKSLVSSNSVTSHLSEIVKMNKRIFNTWF